MSTEQRIEVDRMLRQSTFGGATIDELRTSFAQFMSTMHVTDQATVTETELAELPALRVEPIGAPGRGTILYFHGGSFMVGSPRTALGLTAELVVRTGMSALSLDYRLAPEHPFPAAIEDCLRAYRALIASGISPTEIVLAGDSAGGGLAVTTALAARAAGLPMPAALLAFSPTLDATRSGESMTTKEGIDPLFTRAALVAMGENYSAGEDLSQELLSPAISADLTGLPAVLIQVGSNELLLDDSTRFAIRAAAANVDVTLDVTGDAPHVFPSLIGMLDEADLALERAALFLRQRVAE